MKNIPVAIIIFNRPDFVRKLISILREKKISNVFVIADGPRDGNVSDIENCQLARKVIEEIDWNCSIRTNYSTVNMGLKNRISSGLDWLFGQVDRAIILEDDCMVELDFFDFCEEMLELYKNETRVSVISASNFLEQSILIGESYYFSKYNHCWGWATWARAWKTYQGDIPFWPEWRSSNSWVKLFPNRIERNLWRKTFDKVYSGKLNTSWAVPWMASVWYSGGLTITPKVNMVTNIGFGATSTHTLDPCDPLANLKSFPLGAISHPRKIIINETADKYVFENVFGGKYLKFPNNIFRFPLRIYNLFLRVFKRVIKRK